MGRPLPATYQAEFGTPRPPEPAVPQWLAQWRLACQREREALDLRERAIEALAATLSRAAPTPLPVARWAGIGEAARLTGLTARWLRQLAREKHIVATQDAVTGRWQVRLDGAGCLVRTMPPVTDPPRRPHGAGEPGAAAAARSAAAGGGPRREELD